MLPYREITDEEFFSDCVFYAEELEDIITWGGYEFDAVISIALDKNNEFRTKMVFQNLDESAATALYTTSIKAPEIPLQSRFASEQNLPFEDLFVHYSFLPEPEELVLYLVAFQYEKSE